MDTSKLEKELDTLSKKLSNPEQFSSTQELQDASKRYAQLKNTFDTQKAMEELEKCIKESKKIISEEHDAELIHLAQEELAKAEEEKRKWEEKLEGIGAPPSPQTKSGEIILEIRAGVGGNEAALFAQNLLRMYTRYAERQGWQLTLLDISRSELAGIKEAICGIQGREVFSKLKYESGVHRVQRIPETEKSGRVHTSAASVAVLPKARPIDLHIRSEDLRIDVFRASGPGGQHVNKTSSAVRVTHIPTGTAVASQAGRSQAENKEVAMTILRTRLLQRKQEEAARKLGETRRQQIGTGDRSEKIRTYNIPQDRITDHRIGKSWHNVEHILDGELSGILDELHKAEENKKNTE